jgi:hypothetical protein
MIDRPGHIRIKLTDIPTEFSTEYALHNFAHENTSTLRSLKESMA